MASQTHVLSLLRKEVQQILADKSVLVVAFILPILLVLLYGTGLRLDVKPVSVALVSPHMEDVVSKEIAFVFSGSPYFNLYQVNNALDAQELMRTHEIDAYVLLPNNLAQSIYHREIQVMIVLNGSNSVLATQARSFIESVLSSSVSLEGLNRQVSYLNFAPAINVMAAQESSAVLTMDDNSTTSASIGASTSTSTMQALAASPSMAFSSAQDTSTASATNITTAAISASTGGAYSTNSATVGSSMGSTSSASLSALSAGTSATASSSISSSAAAYKPISITTRNWFNEANESTWYLMAGQLISAITLMSAFMSSIVIAREFERGTLIGLKATNVTAGEILISKFLAYYGLSLLGSSCAILFALIFYELPFRGSALLFILTIMVYLYAIVMLALCLSVGTQNQFLSTQYAIIVSFLPSILLSGAVFDLRSIPAAISYIAYMLPPTYAVNSAKICLLSGGSTDILLRNLLILAGFALLLHVLCYRLLKRHFKRASLKPPLPPVT